MAQNGNREVLQSNIRAFGRGDVLFVLEVSTPRSNG